MRPFVKWVTLRTRGSGRQFGFGLITELRMRSLARRVTPPSEENGKHFSLGLIKENGEPVWEETPQEEGHSFRKYVYEILR